MGHGGHHDGHHGGDHRDLCPDGLYSSPQCCSADVVSLADLDCDVLSETPRNGRDLERICAKDGMEAKCCALGVVSCTLYPSSI